MIKEVEVKVKPAQIENIELIDQLALQKVNHKKNEVTSIRLLRKSIDARGRQPVFRLRLAVYINETFHPEPALLDQLKMVADSPEMIIIGAGPAGYFAALEALELGLKPILYDRGKDVQTRRRDLRAIQQFGAVDANSNYCFGEGGAGTYSDGKLYTRSHKRGNIIKALKLLVEHGADPEILVEAHPHIGSNKLPKIIANIRETIRHFGGEIHFEHKMTDLHIEKGKIVGVTLNHDIYKTAKAVVLATGHSARDIFYLLHKKKVHLEAKPFALGVRIEHQQSLIDKIQYGQEDRAANLPAASYRLNCQIQKRGVFSFCMCPGGLIVPAATAPGEIVVNGMSLSKRDSPFANSGTVVSVELEDLIPYQDQGVFRGLAFQQAVEQKMFNLAGDGSQKAPAQRLTDFVQGKMSTSLNDTSYIPGLVNAPLHELLPPFIGERLRKGVEEFGKKMKGYYTAEANVIGTESRTSTPVRIPRDRATMMHEDVLGLFPCGEGAGYAGGIISAAMDGQNVARAIQRFLDH